MSNFLIFFVNTTWKRIKKCDIFTSLATKSERYLKNKQGRKERVRSATTKVEAEELSQRVDDEKVKDYKLLILDYLVKK